MAMTKYEVQRNDPSWGWVLYAFADSIASARKYREEGIPATGQRFRILKITTTKKVVR